MRLSPVLSYYGSKFKRARMYPPPAHGVIIEPFAGAAGYSLNYADRDVVLVDRDPRIAEIWRWLIGASRDDVLHLPLLTIGQTIDDVGPLPRGARELIRGLVQTSATGRNRLSTNAKNALAANPNTPAFWGEACRARLAIVCEKIKHWTIVEGSYFDVDSSVPATWFVDPPYNNKAGDTYRFNRAQIDYAHLGEWCRSRRGQVIVCENEGATWLPFEPIYGTTLTHIKGKLKKSVEVVYVQ